jgi:prophage antirepressor-like protein
MADMSDASALSKVFTNGAFTLRTAGTHEDPWFCAVDVASALGYSNTHKAVRTHIRDACDKRRLADIISSCPSKDTPGNEYTTAELAMIYVNLAGLNALIFGLPGALAVKRWVFAEVLPSLHRTGSYHLRQTITEQQLAITEQRQTTLLAAMDVRAPLPNDRAKHEWLVLARFNGADLNASDRTFRQQLVRGQTMHCKPELRRRLRAAQRRGARSELGEKQDICLDVVTRISSANARSLFNRCRPTLRANGARYRVASVALMGSTMGERALVKLLNSRHAERLNTTLVPRTTTTSLAMPPAIGQQDVVEKKRDEFMWVAPTRRGRRVAPQRAAGPPQRKRLRRGGQRPDGRRDYVARAARSR